MTRQILSEYNAINVKDDCFLCVAIVMVTELIRNQAFERAEYIAFCIFIALVV